ncbi:MAG: restriction endonuclease [Crenarchaeota archaeon]|nr:restriction endonuclease [Thermoproteota archaeon]MCR8453554.1 restriction endonuclease [Thermoproteota archaeon]MCR8454803.1 restriction endonuclease [Thermoproteota archaeon]MCR8462695.1 restriction endonuclease [Thermoproteota archaeon]MCR8470314.1 restriction endonuclease [Thermoproteota archaeon]
MSESLKNMPLQNLAIRYFEEVLNSHQRNFKIIEPPPSVQKKNAISFIIFIEDTGERWGVIIKDWRRSIGSDTIIKFKRVVESLGLTAGIVIGNKISDLAIEKARRYGLITLTRGEMISFLYSRGAKVELSEVNNDATSNSSREAKMEKE